MNINLKTKFTLSILTVVLVFGAIATVSIFFYAKNIILDLQRENLQKLTVEQSHKTAQFFANAQQLVDGLSTNLDIIEYFQESNKVLQDANIAQHLEHYKVGPAFLAIYIMDSEGKVWLSTEESFLGKNYGFRNYFKNAMLEKTSASVVLGITSKKLGYYFSKPVKNELGQVLGVAVIKINPDYIHEALDLAAYSEESHIMLTDEYGVVLFSDKENRKYKSLGILSESDKEEIELKRSFEGIEIEPLQYNISKTTLDNIDSVAIFDIYDKEDGEQEMLSVTKIADLPFFIVIEESASQYLQPVVNIAYILSLMVALAALAASLSIFIFISKFLKPLKQLKEASQELSKGNLKHKINIKTGDELEDLGNSFNTMSSKLNNTIKNIEKKIAERTTSLEKVNKFMTGRELKMVELKKKIIDLENKK